VSGTLGWVEGCAFVSHPSRVNERSEDARVLEDVLRDGAWGGRGVLSGASDHRISGIPLLPGIFLSCGSPWV